MKSKKIEVLDLLRGFLALCVVLFHIPNLSRAVDLPFYNKLPIFNRGDEAVLVFFTLSGYLIIGLLYDEKKKYGTINIKNFYFRRILRLYPVYYLVLAFGLIYYHYLLPALGVAYELNYSLLEGVLWNVGFMPNVFSQLYKPGTILVILWSIGIEEQFYIAIAPLLLVVTIKKYLKYVIVFTILYFLLFHSPFVPFLRKYSFLYFFISAGGAVALIEKMGFRTAFRSVYLRLLVYLIFVFHFTTNLFQFSHEMANSFFELILYSLVITNLVKDDAVFKKLDLLKYIGQISYGIYMYHMIVLNVVLFLFIKLTPVYALNETFIIILINCCCIGGTILVSHLSYKFYESYFLRLKQKFRKVVN